MLVAAMSSSTILMRNGVFCAYLTADDENSSPPLVAAQTKAIQVQGSTSAVSSVTARAREARFSSRRSTTMIEPTTRTMHSTCTDSIVGKSQVDSRIAVANEVLSRLVSQ